jgi:hypothetical protein
MDEKAGKALATVLQPVIASILVVGGALDVLSARRTSAAQPHQLAVPVRQDVGDAFLHACESVFQAEWGALGLLGEMLPSYPTCEDFVAVALLKTERKHFYELIPAETPCKLYLDVEWTGTYGQEEALQVVHPLVDELKAFARVRVAVECCTAACKKILK